MPENFNEPNFRCDLDNMSVSDIRQAIISGKYTEPAKSVALEVLTLRASTGVESRDSVMVIVQIMQFGVAAVALLVALAAYFKP